LISKSIIVASVFLFSERRQSNENMIVTFILN
jgi:hypothetical protein